MDFTRTLKNAFRSIRLDPAERYLNEATSLLDLEHREREITRGRFANRRFR